MAFLLSEELIEDFPQWEERLVFRTFRTSKGTEGSGYLVTHYTTKISPPAGLLPSDEPVPIDNRMVPVISRLWEHGVPTQFCCSGHKVQVVSPARRDVHYFDDGGMLFLPTAEHWDLVLVLLSKFGIQPHLSQAQPDGRVLLRFPRLRKETLG